MKQRKPLRGATGLPLVWDWFIAGWVYFSAMSVLVAGLHSRRCCDVGNDRENCAQFDDRRRPELMRE